MRITLLIGLLLTIIFPLVAQIQPPRFNCIKGDSLIYGKPTNPCGDFNAFEVFGSQNRTGPYTLLGTITDIDEFAFEHKTADNEVWYYYMQSDYDCAGLPVLQSDTIDNQRPDVSPLISVSIENDIVILDWEPSLSPQTWGYIIYRVTDEGTVPIDSTGDTFFIDIFAAPNEQSETYFVNALDQCGNTSAFVEPHSSIFLEVTANPCTQSANLNWNAYENWINGVEGYGIWVRQGNDVAERIDFIPGDQTTYNYTGLENGIVYDFFVEAVETNTGVAAKSNIIQIDEEVIVPIGDLLVKNITFNDNNELELLWEWNANAELESIEILRSFDNASFESVGNPEFSSPLPDPATLMVDPTHAKEMKTFYRVSTQDKCDSSTISNYISTIHLTAAPLPNQSNLLNWTPYDSKIGTVNGYAIYKIVDDMPIFLANVPSNTLSYTDPVQPNGVPSPCYYIEADISVTFARSGIETHSSRSNTTCISQMADLVMPNAFAPRGTNQVFKPTILFGASVQNYQFIIYNRYGGIVFESNDPTIGWNGQKDGKDVPMGAYTYFVRLEQADGSKLEDAGVMMLLR